MSVMSVRSASLEQSMEGLRVGQAEAVVPRIEGLENVLPHAVSSFEFLQGTPFAPNADPRIGFVGMRKVGYRDSVGHIGFPRQVPHHGVAGLLDPELVEKVRAKIVEKFPPREDVSATMYSSQATSVETIIDMFGKSLVPNVLKIYEDSVRAVFPRGLPKDPIVLELGSSVGGQTLALIAAMHRTAGVLVLADQDPTGYAVLISHLGTLNTEVIMTDRPPTVEQIAELRTQNPGKLLVFGTLGSFGDVLEGLPNDCFDAVVSDHGIVYAQVDSRDPDEDVLARFVGWVNGVERVMKPGGTVVVTVLRKGVMKPTNLTYLRVISAMAARCWSWEGRAILGFLKKSGAFMKTLQALLPWGIAGYCTSLESTAFRDGGQISSSATGDGLTQRFVLAKGGSV